jgi:hypothetical protein
MIERAVLKKAPCVRGDAEWSRMDGRDGARIYEFLNEF